MLLSESIGVWKAELTTHFPQLPFRYYIGSKIIGNTEDKEKTLERSKEDLAR